jgi:hypothetical protein
MAYMIEDVIQGSMDSLMNRVSRQLKLSGVDDKSITMFEEDFKRGDPIDVCYEYLGFAGFKSN